MMFLVNLFLTWLLLAFPCAVSKPDTMITAANTTKHGCPRQCGNLTIPYPFGLSKSCAMGDDYIFNCITRNGSSRLFFDNSSVILDLSETQLLITTGPAAVSCNRPASKGIGDLSGSFDFTTKPFAVSPASNKFVVTGCHKYGLIHTQTRRRGREVVSCVALCTEERDLLDGSCFGIGCCQAPIPVGLQKMTMNLQRIVYNTSISSGNCSYAFLVERSSFHFRGAIDLLDPKFLPRVAYLPLMLEWFVTNKTCKEAQSNPSTYACQQNTTCVDLDLVLDVKGYRCKCRDGYQGNPYLSPGCTDINECVGSNNPCSNICVNTPGGYKCSCPSGHQGDGKKNGTGYFPKSLKYAFVLGLSMGLGSILFLLGGFWAFIIAERRKKTIQKAKNFKRNGGLLLQEQLSSDEGMIEKTRLFTADELEKATDQFNTNRILGHGGQGIVYKGMLNDGSIVAIKKSRVVDQRQLDQFINEVVILSQINHRNIVKLLGCCLETEVPLLAYEYIPNGALSKFIHNQSEDFPVTWEMRLQIATDVAGALTYLHSGSSKLVLHRDIKTSNILLDERYKAKLSDFGISRSIAIDQTHLTTRVQGTFGYLDPEYFRSNQFTEKSDVYSFGVVLAELLTGQRAIRVTSPPGGESLVSWFLSAMASSKLDEVLADQVANVGKKEAVFAVAQLTKKCVNIDGKQRPTMREVWLELQMISQLQQVSVSCTENQKEEIDQNLTKMIMYEIDGPLPPSTSITEDDYS